MNNILYNIRLAFTVFDFKNKNKFLPCGNSYDVVINFNGVRGEVKNYI